MRDDSGMILDFLVTTAIVAITFVCGFFFGDWWRGEREQERRIREVEEEEIEETLREESAARK
jgi:hypothetical protein